MAEMGDEKNHFGCSAWIDSIRGSVNDRLEKARNKRRAPKDGKKYEQLATIDPMTKTASGDTTPADPKMEELRPRSPVPNMQEDMHSLHTMIASLDGADCGKSEQPPDKHTNWSAGLPWTDIDVDNTVWEVLRKASREYEEELGSVKNFLASSPTLTSGLSSPRDQEETFSVEPFKTSSDGFDVDIQQVCKHIETRL